MSEELRYWIFTIAWLTLGLWAAGHAVVFKRDSRSALIWVLLSFTFPIVGPWFYWVVGINRVERKALKHLGRRDRPFFFENTAKYDRDEDVYFDSVAHLDGLRLASDRITRLPLVPGNRIEPLFDGEQAYPAMLEAIASAEQTITLTSYIFDWDEVGHEFADALDQAAHRGVRVHVLIDGIGALGVFSRMGRRLKKSGAEVAAFYPLRFPLGRLRLNLRNHRKILVVDGRTGFTGGMNISKRHLAHRSDPRRVHDLHFRLTGPIVAELQHAFIEDWATATGTTLEGDGYFNALPNAGPALCRGISSGPDEDFQIIHLLLESALAAARSSVRITTPYFVPTSSLVSSLVTAALRGVDISLLLPSHMDRIFMRWAADAYLWQLLEHGIRVYLRPPPFVHTKLMVVDERWVLLGSANLDRRSFRLNFEFNVEAYDVELARQMAAWLDEDAAKCHQVTLEEMDTRPMWKRLRDGTAKLLSPQL
ncbi:MAG: cardiolipin synthase [Phycisphaerae bacterium]|nr:cardiolipin synthase [Phycisphaerae bacterium]